MSEKTERFFVYYSDGYADDGCLGFEGFESQAEAVEFIERRIVEHGATLDCYELIQGRKLTLEAVETVSRVAVKYK